MERKKIFKDLLVRYANFGRCSLSLPLPHKEKVEARCVKEEVDFFWGGEGREEEGFFQNLRCERRRRKRKEGAQTQFLPLPSFFPFSFRYWVLVTAASSSSSSFSDFFSPSRGTSTTTLTRKTQTLTWLCNPRGQNCHEPDDDGGRRGF